MLYNTDYKMDGEPYSIIDNALDLFRKDKLFDDQMIDYKEVPSRFIGSSPDANVLSFETGTISYAYLPRSYVMLKCQWVTNPGGDDPEQGRARISPHGWSIFSHASLTFLNGGSVEEVRYPGRIAYIMRLAEKSKQWIMEHGKDEHFYPLRYTGYTQGSETVQLTAADETTVHANHGGDPVSDEWDRPDKDNNYNHSFALASQHGVSGVAGDDFSNEFWIKLPLEAIFGFARVQKLLPNIKIRLNLQRESTVGNYVTSTNNDQMRIKILDSYLVVPQVTPNERLFLSVREKYANGEPIPLQVLKFGCEVLNSNSDKVSIPFNTSGRRIKHLFILPQRKDIFNNETRDHSTVGALETWSQAHLVMDEKTYPRDSIYYGETHGYIREYQDFLKYAAKDVDPSMSPWVSFEKWKKIYPIFYFDLSQDDPLVRGLRDSKATFNITWSTEVGAASNRDYTFVYLYEDDYNYDVRTGLLQPTKI